MTTLCGSGPSPDSRRSLQRAWSGPQRWELAEREWTVANTTRREKLDLVVGHRAARIKEASEEKAPKPDGEPLAKKHSRAQAFRAKVKEEDRAHYQEKSQILAQLCEARCDPPSWRLPACLPACWRLGRTGCTANMTEEKINVELTSRIGPDGLVHHVVSSMAGPPPKKQRNSDGREPEPRGPSDPPSEISSATWRARKKQLVKEAEALQEAGDISQMDLTLIRQIVPSDPSSLLRRYWASRDAAKRTSTGIAQLLDSVRRTAPATVAVNWCGGGGGGARALATGGRGEQQHGGDAVAGGQHGVAAATAEEEEEKEEEECAPPPPPPPSFLPSLPRRVHARWKARLPRAARPSCPAADG